jgi:hypothetical protein
VPQAAEAALLSAKCKMLAPAPRSINELACKVSPATPAVAVLPSLNPPVLTVQDVLEYLAGGMTEEEILRDFSELTREDIKACLAFAADRERKLFVAPA